MLTREAKQQLDLHISDYKDELGEDDFADIYENVRMTPVRRIVRAVERWVDKGHTTMRSGWQKKCV